MTTALPPITQFDGRKFDRVPRWDPSNERFMVRNLAAPAKAAFVPPKTKTRTRRTWLDQGDEGGCTGFSEATALSFSPHGSSKIANGNGEYLYGLAKSFDEYPGVDYEGSSVLGSMQGSRATGLITNYFWATTADEVIQAICTVGVGIFGINWYSGMFNPDASGIIRVTGSVVGGHAICGSSIKNGGDLIRLDNTWGKGWGKSGSAWIPAEDVSRLLNEQGEFACFTKAVPMPALQSSGRIDPATPGAGVTGA